MIRRIFFFFFDSQIEQNFINWGRSPLTIHPYKLGSQLCVGGGGVLHLNNTIRNESSMFGQLISYLITAPTYIQRFPSFETLEQTQRTFHNVLDRTRGLV